MKRCLFLLIFIFSLSFSDEISQNSDLDFLDEDYLVEEVQKEKIETVRVIQGKKIEIVDPAYIKDNYSKRVVPLIYQTLFKYDDNGKVVPNILEKYEWLSGRELYLRLKDDIYFHNGEKLTSYDVKDSLEFIKENGALKDIFIEISDIKILSNTQLVIKLEEEDNTFLEILTSRVTAIAKRKGEKIYGTSRYYVKSFDNNSLVLERFKRYERSDFHSENIIFSWEIQDRQRCISLFNEEAEVICDVDKSALEYGKSYGIITDENIIFEDRDLKTLALTFGNQRNFTREMKKAIESIVEREATSFFPKEVCESSFSKIDISKDREKSIELMKKSNLRRYMKLMILNTEKHTREAEKIKKEMKNYGIEIEILPHNVESYNQKIQDGDYEIAIFTIPLAKGGILFNIAKIFMSDLENIEIYNSLAPFLKKLKEEPERKNREIIEDKILQLIYSEMPYIPISHFRDYTVVSPDLRDIFCEWEKK